MLNRLQLAATSALTAIIVSGGLTAQAQSSQPPADSQTEQSDQRYEEALRKRDSERNQVVQCPPGQRCTASGVLAPLRAIDQLPPESAEHLQDARIQIVQAVGVYDPSDTAGNFPYQPSREAELDPALKNLEQEAWDELVTGIIADARTASGQDGSGAPSGGDGQTVVLVTGDGTLNGTGGSSGQVGRDGQPGSGEGSPQTSSGQSGGLQSEPLRTTQVDNRAASVYGWSTPGASFGNRPQSPASGNSGAIGSGSANHVTGGSGTETTTPTSSAPLGSAGSAEPAATTPASGGTANTPASPASGSAPASGGVATSPGSTSSGSGSGSATDPAESASSSGSSDADSTDSSSGGSQSSQSDETGGISLPLPDLSFGRNDAETEEEAPTTPSGTPAPETTLPEPELTNEPEAATSEASPAPAEDAAEPAAPAPETSEAPAPPEPETAEPDPEPVDEDTSTEEDALAAFRAAEERRQQETGFLDLLLGVVETSPTPVTPAPTPVSDEGTSPTVLTDRRRQRLSEILND